MSGNSAAKTLLQIKVAGMKARGKEISKEEEAQLLKEIKASYDEKLSPYYAASRLWVDGIIEPADTRSVISKGIEAANHAPITDRFNVGILQT
jgi:acetyl-CoA carboxylase carboxyltransferase component